MARSVPPPISSVPVHFPKIFRIFMLSSVLCSPFEEIFHHCSFVRLHYSSSCSFLFWVFNFSSFFFQQSREWWRDLDVIPENHEHFSDVEALWDTWQRLQLLIRRIRLSSDAQPGPSAPVPPFPGCSTSTTTSSVVAPRTPRGFHFRQLPSAFVPDVPRYQGRGRPRLGSVPKKNVTFDRLPSPREDNRSSSPGGLARRRGLKSKLHIRKSPRCHASTVELISHKFSPTKGERLLASLRAGRRPDEDSSDSSFGFSPDRSFDEDDVNVASRLFPSSPSNFYRPPTDDRASFLRSVGNQVRQLFFF